MCLLSWSWVKIFWRFPGSLPTCTNFPRKNKCVGQINHFKVHFGPLCDVKTKENDEEGRKVKLAPSPATWCQIVPAGKSPPKPGDFPPQPPRDLFCIAQRFSDFLDFQFIPRFSQVLSIQSKPRPSRHYFRNDFPSEQWMEDAGVWVVWEGSESLIAACQEELGEEEKEEVE